MTKSFCKNFATNGTSLIVHTVSFSAGSVTKSFCKNFATNGTSLIVYTVSFGTGGVVLERSYGSFINKFAASITRESLFCIVAGIAFNVYPFAACVFGQYSGVTVTGDVNKVVGGIHQAFDACVVDIET